MKSNSLLNRNRKGYLNPLRNPISNSSEWEALKIQEPSLRILLVMKSNLFLNKKRKFYLNLLRNPISKSREWKGLNIKDNPLLKPVSNGDECRDLIRDDDRLPSPNQVDKK
ncbi:hypothetical protein Goshw_007182 [Gossypium schwendimanii]|uniref:Uncharacterized protein n=1 Tax=Gossypium schwendimanii TaxID=34291 RepID=A0A7J9MGG3_GOSSC|nr:hypothetical protein [Gossypium schwendimanii]